MSAAILRLPQPLRYSPRQATDRWAAAVRVNGGDVTSARYELVATMIESSMASGHFWRVDDLGILAAESEIQALTSIKQLRLGSVTNAPTFTTDRDYAFNATTQYLNTGFIPAQHAVNFTRANGRLSIYERANAAGVTAGYSMGIGNSLGINTADASGVMRVLVNSGVISLTGSTAADRRGLNSVSRFGASYRGYRRGLLSGSNTVSTSPLTPSSLALFIGGVNSAGSLASGVAISAAYWSVGGAMPDEMELAEQAFVQAHMTAIGAEV